MSHANAPLTPAGRLRLVRRCEYRPIAHVAAEAGISRQCLSKWKARFDALGVVGLLDRASVPHNSPTQLDPDLVALIEGWRRDQKWSARAIHLELTRRGHTVSAATVGRWLVRLGISRRADIDPDGSNNEAPDTITARYPGHMLHLDVKKVGRIPDGGGWRAHGRGSTQDRAAQRAKTSGARAGYVYLHSAVDGYSRLAYTEHLVDEKATTTIGCFHRAWAFFAAHGINRMVRVITDNGPNYTAAAFYRTVTAVASRHQRIRAHTPAQRQGREIQPDPGRRTPLRPHLDVRGPTGRNDHDLGHPLQLPSTPHRRRRPAPGLTPPRRRHQRREPEHLGA